MDVATAARPTHWDEIHLASVRQVYIVLSCLFVASLIGEYTWKVACSRLIDKYFGSFLFKIGDVTDEERLSFQIINPVDPRIISVNAGGWLQV